MPVPLESVERIEVLAGPGSRHLGAGAFSGAINIITKQADNNLAELSLSGGQFGYYSGTGYVGYNLNGVKQAVSFNTRSSDGYIKNTDFKDKSIFYTGKTSIKNVGFDWQYGYTNKEFGANSFYTAKYPDQFEQTRTHFASLSSEFGHFIRFKPQVYYRENHDRFELFRSNPASWYKGHNYHFTQLYGGGLNASHASKFGVTSLVV